MRRLRGFAALMPRRVLASSRRTIEQWLSKEAPRSIAIPESEMTAAVSLPPWAVNVRVFGATGRGEQGASSDLDVQ